MTDAAASHGSRMRFPLSIRAKLAILVAVSVVLTAGSLSTLGFVMARRVLFAGINDRFSAELSARQELLDLYISQQLEAVGIVVSRTRLRQLLELKLDGRIADQEFLSQCGRIMHDVLRGTSGFVDILAADPTGVVVTAADASVIGTSIAGSPEFVNGREARYFGEPRRAGSRYEAPVSAPATSNGGRLLGVVIVNVDLAPMIGALGQTDVFGRGVEISMASGDGDQARYFFADPSRPAVQRIALSKVPAMALAIEQRTGFMRAHDERGVAVLAAYRPVGYRNWGLVATIPVAEAYQPVYRLRNVLIVLDLTILLIAVASALVLAGRLTRPIVHLTRTASGVSATGDFSVRATRMSRDELGVLTDAFNNMLEQVQDRNGKLRQVLQELDHRVRNTLATVQAVADQTLRSSRSLEDFSDAFRGRLAALARTHSAVGRSDWAGLSLRELVNLTLSPFATQGERLVVEGEDLTLRPGPIRVLGMAFNELATNATKYGALSTPGGRVTLSWRVESSPHGPWLWLTWLESGGPPVKRPATRGMGSTLIERSVPYELEGEVALEFRPTGVRCRIGFPLATAMAA